MDVSRNNMQNESTLFKKMQEGDWDTFNSFFDQYMEELCLYALGVGKNWEEAEDIVQENFIYLWGNRAKISYSGSVYACLHRTVKTHALTLSSTLKSKGNTSERCWYCRMRPLRILNDMDELYRKLQIVLENLPPKCKEIFILGCVEEGARRSIRNIREHGKTQVKVAYKKIKSEFGSDNKFLILFLCTILLGK